MYSKFNNKMFVYWLVTVMKQSDKLLELFELTLNVNKIFNLMERGVNLLIVREWKILGGQHICIFK